MVENMVTINYFLKTKLPKTREKSGEKSNNKRIIKNKGFIYAFPSVQLY